VCTALQNAYVFLRNLEHRLQEFSDQQTHRLPTDAGEKRRLALSMGFEDPLEWNRQLETQREIVHNHFSLLLESKSARETDQEHELSALWLGLLEENRRERLLADIGYEPPASAWQILEHLQTELAQQPLAKEGHQRLDKLMPLLLKAAGTSSAPLITLERISGLIKAIDGRASYLALLLENPGILDHLVRLSSASSLIATFLARHPVLLDELLDPPSQQERARARIAAAIRTDARRPRIPDGGAADLQTGQRIAGRGSRCDRSAALDACQ
jgi:glutamate-ammonia-ligase adenylyltransferase